MKKLFCALLALIMLLCFPVSALAAVAEIGELKYNEELKAVQYILADGQAVEHDIVENGGHVYTVSDSAVSLIDGEKRGTLEIGDKLYYIDSSRAFSEEEYAELIDSVISPELTDFYTVSGVEYFFKKGALFTGILDGKYYDRGLYSKSFTGSVTVDNTEYYIYKGSLANGLRSSKFYVDGIVDKTKNGLLLIGDKEYYFKSGELATALVTERYGENAGKRVYYKKGRFNAKTGPVNIGDYGYYFENGIAKGGKLFVKGNYRYYSKKSFKLIKNKTFKIGKFLYTADSKGILNNASLVYIQQNTPENELISYPSGEKPLATIASGGCGVCTSLMIIKNSTSYSPSLVSWKNKMMKYGCRVNGGTDIRKTAKLLKKKYGFKYKKTTSVEKLKKHLKKGYMAICNVGVNGYFSSGGHYIVAAGIDKNGNVIILDPYMTPTKYYSTCKGVDRRKYFKYDSTTNEVTCTFNTLKAGSRGEYYYLFTPTKNISLRKSAK